MPSCKIKTRNSYVRQLFMLFGKGRTEHHVVQTLLVSLNVHHLTFSCEKGTRQQIECVKKTLSGRQQPWNTGQRA